MENIQFYITCFWQTSFSMIFAYIMYTYTNFDNYGFIISWAIVETLGSIFQISVYFYYEDKFFDELFLKNNNNKIEFVCLENY